MLITTSSEPKVTFSICLLLSNLQSKTQRVFICYHKWQREARWNKQMFEHVFASNNSLIIETICNSPSFNWLIAAALKKTTVNIKCIKITKICRDWLYVKTTYHSTNFTDDQYSCYQCCHVAGISIFEAKQKKKRHWYLKPCSVLWGEIWLAWQFRFLLNKACVHVCSEQQHLG